jgi:Ca2+-binding RTX toxin-like protein
MRLSPRITAVPFAVLAVASFGLVPTGSVAAAAGTTRAGITPTIVGTPGDDVLSGTPGDDVILALGGDDAVAGGGGDDVICGGGGSDVINGDDGNDVLLGGPGNDSEDGGAGLDTASFAMATAEVDASLVTGEATGEGTDTLSDVEDLTGPVAAMGVLTGDAGDNVLTGGNDISVLTGGPGADTLIGGPRGWATLLGGAGDDTLIGGERGDELDGGRGDDVLRAGAGGDGLVGGPGDDAIGGGPGDDVVRFLGAKAPVTADLATGIATGEGADVLSGVEEVVGGPFADRLVGNDRTNLLSGFAGNDRLNGGIGGYDTILGGPGVDACRNAARVESCERRGAAAHRSRRSHPRPMVPRPSASARSRAG